MPFTNMSDGRNFTNYESAKQQMAHYRNMYNIGDSKSLRHSLQKNAENIMNKPLCTPRQAEGMAVLCGGPMSQYVSEKSTITEFPKGPIV